MKQLLRYLNIDSLDNRDPELIDRIYRCFSGLLERYFRAEVRGVERIPTGAALYVGNHSSGLLTPDSFLFGSAVYRQRGLADVPYGLAHEVAIRLPLIHQLIVRLGAVRASHENGQRLLARGDKVIVYPGGDRDAFRAYRKRRQIIFGGRTGYIRLALSARVPIVPVVSAGAHEMLIVLDERNWTRIIPGLDRLLRTHVYPTTLSLPWGITPGIPLVYLPLPVKVLMEILPPIRFELEGPAAAEDPDHVATCDRQVRETMQATLDRLYRERDA